MHDELTLERLDKDGALLEALAGVSGESRADFLRKAVVGGSALLAAVAVPTMAFGATTRNDQAILNYALVLEYLQAAFYTEALRLGGLQGRLREQASVVGAHERGHVAALRKTLGSDAVERPTFNFGGATESPNAFRRTAVAFEDLGVAAYKGQAPAIASPAFLAAALAIHSVEARHAAWIRRLAGATPAAKAFDQPLTEKRVRQIVASTRFIAQTRRKARPSYTG